MIDVIIVSHEVLSVGRTMRIILSTPTVTLSTAIRLPLHKKVFAPLQNFYIIANTNFAFPTCWNHLHAQTSLIRGPGINRPKASILSGSTAFFTTVLAICISIYDCRQNNWILSRKDSEWLGVLLDWICRHPGYSEWVGVLPGWICRHSGGRGWIEDVGVFSYRKWSSGMWDIAWRNARLIVKERKAYTQGLFIRLITE